MSDQLYSDFPGERPAGVPPFRKDGKDVEICQGEVWCRVYVDGFPCPSKRRFATTNALRQHVRMHVACGEILGLKNGVYGKPNHATLVKWQLEARRISSVLALGEPILGDTATATVIRRSTIDLQNSSTISDARIEEIVKHAIYNTPTPFDVQSTRAVVLLCADHEKLWNMTYKHAKKNYPPDVFAAHIVPSLKATKESYGTVLFFDDPEAVNAMPPGVCQLMKMMPEWVEQSSGMAQYAVWTAFSAEGMSANIQHYQKGGLAEKVNAEWGLPAHWDLKCQMPFGTPDEPPNGGVQKHIEPRVRVFGKQ